MNKTDKNKRFLTIILLLISLVIVVILSMFLLDTTGKINQGHFRISDLVVSSTVVVEDKRKTPDEVEVSTETTDQTINSLSDLLLDVSQKNEIMFLVTTSESVEASQMYIDNVKIDYPNLMENMFIYQNAENMIDLKTENIKVDLVKEDKEGQYLVILNVDNINCIRDATITNSELSSVKFDGTILNLLNKDISDFMFELSFNLNIIDSLGKSNISKINLKLPNKLLATNGISIISEDVGKFPFMVK